jgi:hypothetical protein
MQKVGGIGVVPKDRKLLAGDVLRFGGDYISLMKVVWYMETV